MRKDGRKIIKNYGTQFVTFIDNYDGDTFRCDSYDWPPVVGRAIPVRIANIQAPERFKGTDDQKLAAEQSRQFLYDILSKAKLIQLIGISRGKYFRLVANVTADRIDVGELMIINHHAVPMQSGGEKKETEAM